MASPRMTTYWITCADGLEVLLADELAELGAHVVSRSHGRLVIEGSLETAYRICLWSRLASRVLLPIHSVPIKRQDVRDVAEELYEGARDFDWSLIFSPASTFMVRLQAERGIKLNTQFATLRVKDGVVDAFMDAQGRRPSIDTRQPEITLLAIAGMESHQYCLDLSGDSLHRRGYRQNMTDAPIKENLAAAMLRQLGWHHKQHTVLCDPLCGSGTFVIEALWMWLDHAPGLNRTFGFQGWHGHDHALWQLLRQEAHQRLLAGWESPLPRVYAYDADWEAVKATRQNVLAAGLKDALPSVHIEERSLNEWPADLVHTGEKAMVITNPPYGERLGNKLSNRALYQGLAYRLQQRFAGQQVGVIAAQVEQADVLPLVNPQTLRLMNGNLPIYFRSGELQPAPATVGLLARWEAPSEVSDEGKDFANRLIKNLSHLRKLAGREQVSCLRIYDADLPDFNLAIDLYENWLHVQEYAPPKSIDPDKARQRFQLALGIIRHVLAVSREQVFIKTRAKQKGSEQYEKKGDQGKLHIVREGQARLYVNFTDYLDTGLFLDHRPMRLKIASLASGKHFLNLYCYTATASVHAALAGAASTTSVDLSNTYQQWGKQNFALNGLPVDHPARQHEFYESDVFEWLKQGSEQYDLIFIDPPTFSNSKKFQGTFDVQRDHYSLLKRAMNRLAPGGLLLFSNNFRKFELDERLAAEFDIHEISAQTIGFDFKRNAGIHHAWEIRHPGVGR